MPFAIRYEKNILARVHLVPNWRPDIVFAHGAQYLMVLVSHGSSISRTQYLSQYLTTVSHDTPVSHASISRFQYLNFSI